MRNLDLLVLASGSRGNAAVVRNAATGRCVLIDCGICKRDFLARCRDLGIDPTSIETIFISHEHIDHTKGLGVVLRSLAKEGVHPVLCASEAVRNASSQVREVCGLVGEGAPKAAVSGSHAGGRAHASAAGFADADAMLGEADALVPYRPFRAGDVISAAGMQVHAFPTSHDCSESFGFRVECDGDALGWMTDSGIVTPQAHEALSNVRVLGIESNHDLEMLRVGPYPWSLKQRVGGEFGHLSNDQCLNEVASLLHPNLEQIACLHISENNNTYGLPRRTVEQLLRREDHPATVVSACQHAGCAVFANGANSNEML